MAVRNAENGVVYFVKSYSTSTAYQRKLFNQIIGKSEHCLHYLLPTAREQSVTDRLRSANYRAYFQRLTDSKTFICYSENSLQCE